MIGKNDNVKCESCGEEMMANRIRSTGFKTKYDKGFLTPQIIEKELRKTFKPNSIVFVSSMGDMWGGIRLKGMDS